jgi:hypothetical protein
VDPTDNLDDINSGIFNFGVSSNEDLSSSMQQHWTGNHEVHHLLVELLGNTITFLSLKVALKKYMDEPELLTCYAGPLSSGVWDSG